MWIYENLKLIKQSFSAVVSPLEVGGGGTGGDSQRPGNVCDFMTKCRFLWESVFVILPLQINCDTV